MGYQTSKIFGSLLWEMKDDGTGLLHIIRTDKTFVRDDQTGKLLMAPTLESVAVTQEDAATLLGQQMATVSLQLQTVTAERDAAIADAAAKATTIAEKDTAIASKEAALSAAQAQVAALQEQLTGQPQDGVATVTAVQARLALAHPSVGKLDEIDAFIQALPASDARKIFYEHALTWRRDNPHVIELAGVFGIEDDEIDALFALAKTLS